MNKEEKKESLLTGYKITTDEYFIQSLFPIPNILQEQLGDLYHSAQKGKKSSLPKFLKLIEKYPKIPILKNYLSVLYNTMGMTQKADDVTKWIIAEHPNYLFGKINLAIEYWQNKEYEKMPEVLGKEMDLKILFPDRETFHIDEIVSFFSTTIFYFAEIGDIEEAEARLDLIREIHPDNHKVKYAEKVIFSAKMRKMVERMDEEKRTQINVKIKKTKSGNQKEMPNFLNPEIKWLYDTDFSNDNDSIIKILSLPRKSLISDLIKILDDSINRYNFFINRSEEVIVRDGFSSMFLIHSFFIIGEIKAEELLDEFLFILSQDKDYLDFYLGDVLTEVVWEVIYKIGHDDLNKLQEFMCKPGINTFSKSAVLDAVKQIASYQPERMQEVFNWHSYISNFFLNSKIEDNVIDSAVIGFFVSNIIDLKFTELLPQVEMFYQKQIIAISICGSFDSVKELINSKNKYDYKKEFSTVFEQCNSINNWNNDEDSEYEDNEWDEDNYNQEPIIKEPKPGRNDLCSCGSGKKYKKCCMNK